MHPVDAAQIDAALGGIGPSVVMRVDATNLAKVVLRHVGAKAVGRQNVGAFDDLHARCDGRNGCGLPADAKRTIAAGWVKTIKKLCAKFNRAAMTSRSDFHRRTLGMRLRS